jgi:hypothetical protein
MLPQRRKARERSLQPGERLLSARIELLFLIHPFFRLEDPLVEIGVLRDDEDSRPGIPISGAEQEWDTAASSAASVSS